MPANKLSTWGDLETALTNEQFASFGEPAALFMAEDAEPLECSVIFDMSYEAIDPDGYARVVKVAELENALNAKTGQRLSYKNLSWRLLKKLEDDGFSTAFEVTEWRS